MVHADGRFVPLSRRLRFLVPQPPNVLVITCHDLGRHLGCYGIPTVQSPNLDRLAGEGVRFAGAFCTAPQCSPARASLFTGRYPHANGVMGLCHGRFGWDLNHDEQHLAAMMAGSGRHSVLAHHQHETRRPDDMGYDRILVGDAVHPAGRVVDEVSAFLKTRTSADAPFFLQLGFFEPHRPFEIWDTPPDDERGVTIPPWLVDDAGARAEFAGFQGAIRSLDRAIGRLLAALDGAGLAANTIVVFTADHGIPFPRAKCSLYDPGLEVALIVRWPAGGLPDGSVPDPMVSHLDVVPTLLDLCGAPIPANLHGRSLAPLLRGETWEPRDAVFGQITHHDYCDPRRCIRTRTHKLIVNFTNAPFFMDPSQAWRPKTITKDPADPAGTTHDPVELYDLMADPGETCNLARSDAHRTTCRELLRRLHRWMQETSDPMLQGIPTPPIYDRAMRALTGKG